MIEIESLEPPLLHAAMFRSGTLNEARYLRPDDFRNPDNGALWNVLLTLDEKGAPPDPVVVSKHLLDGGCRDKPIMTSAFANAMAIGGDDGNWAYYAENIKEDALQRRFEAAAGNLADTRKVLTEIDEWAHRRTGRRNEFTALDGQRMLTDWLERNYKIAKSGQLPGIPTGFEKLDGITGGLISGNLVVVAARTSIGKSAFCLRMAAEAINRDVPTSIYSLEMGVEECSARFASMETGVPFSKMKNGTLGMGEMRAVSAFMGRQAEKNYIIDTTPGLTPARLREKVRQDVEDRGVKLVIVDHVGLMKSPDHVGDKRGTMDACIEAQKEIGLDLGVAIVTAAQLRREAEEKDDRRPRLSDLKESSGIEENADIVVLLQRQRDAEAGEVLVAKHRGGEIGMFDADFHGPTMRWSQSDGPKW